MHKYFAPLPECVRINSKSYKINTDFRIWLEISEVLSSGISVKDKLCFLIVNAFCESLPDNMNDAVNALIEFMNMGKTSSGGGSKEKIISFYEDRYIINAAFRQQYGINLFCDKLHWWEFCTLLSALNEDTLFMKIVSFRSVDINNIKDGDRKKYYRRMKNRYRLEAVVNEADIADIIDSLQ